MFSFKTKWAGIFLLATLVGCNSTPYRDDYARHVNTMKKSPLEASSFQMIFSDGDQVDLRALYDNDTTMGSTNMMYQGAPGAAGLIALVAQIGVHSSIVSSQREERLASLQDSANSQIQPLLNLTGGMQLSALLVPEHQPWLTTSLNPETDTLYIKPIFFSNTEMTQLSVKVVAWIPDPKGSKKQPDKYKNLIQVLNAPLSAEQRTQLISGDQAMLQSMLSDLLSTALEIAHGATTGKFANVQNTMKTYKLPNSDKNKVFRATHIADTCEHTIVRNLRQWLIAIPKASAEEDQLASQSADANQANADNTAAASAEGQCTAGV